MNFKLIRSKASAAVMSLAKVSRPFANGQGDRAVPNGGEKEKLIPRMVLAGLLSTAWKFRKTERTIMDTKIEV